MQREQAARFIATGLELVQRVDEVISAYDKLSANPGSDAPQRIQELYAACHNLKEARQR